MKLNFIFINIAFDVLWIVDTEIAKFAYLNYVNFFLIQRNRMVKKKSNLNVFYLASFVKIFVKTSITLTND
jgi:hypothetical protein